MTLLPAILVVREDCEFSRILRSKGYDVVNLPLISTRPKSDLSFFCEILSSIGSYDAIFISSRFAAEIFADELEGLTLKLPRIYVVGTRSKEILEGRGIEVENRQVANSANDLLEQIDEASFEGRTVLFIRGGRSLEVIPDRLRRYAKVVETSVYETRENRVERPDIVDRIARGKIGWACFFSPSGVEAYVSNGFHLGGSMSIAAIGATTADAIRKLGHSAAFVSENSDARSFAESLAAFIERFG